MHKSSIKIDRLVYLSAKALASADKLYGLIPEEIKIVEKQAL